MIAWIIKLFSILWSLNKAYKLVSVLQVFSFLNPITAAVKAVFDTIKAVWKGLPYWAQIGVVIILTFFPSYWVGRTQGHRIGALKERNKIERRERFWRPFQRSDEEQIEQADEREVSF